MSELDRIKKDFLKEKEEPQVQPPTMTKEEIEKIKEEMKKQKLETIKEPITVEKKSNTEFTSEEREGVIKKVLDDSKKGRVKLRRREKKIIKNGEYDSTSGKTKEITITLAVVGIVLVVLLRNFIPNQAMYLLLIIIGVTSFFPMGMMAGWIMFDPVMRCKIIRKVTKRNYGVVNFVGHGSKIIPKIKNFDESLIWKQNECWVLTKGKVYQMTKDPNAITEGKVINDTSIVTYVDTVPVLFVDMHSMEPLELSGTDRVPVYPEEIGSALKAWVDNQRAKMMSLKKMEGNLMIILLICAAAAAGLAFMTMTKVEEMAETIQVLREQIGMLAQAIQQNPP